MRKKSLPNLMILLALSVACMVSGVFLLTGCMAKAGPTAMASPITANQTLFNADGTHNSTLVTQLVTLAESSQKTLLSGTVYTSNFGQLTNANNGSAPIVNLFESGGTGTTQTFRDQAWRLVYVTNSTSSAPVFTFMMAGAYKNSAFGLSNVYESSTLRTSLNNEFAAVLDDFPNAAERIVMPSKLPGAWQSNQPDAGSATHNSIATSILSDKIWLPSSLELGDGTVAGAVDWNLGASGGYAQNGFANTAWLRSRNSTGSNTRTVSTSGIFNSTSSFSNIAVRPAIHLSFPTITDAAPIFNTSGIHNATLTSQFRQLAAQAGKTTVGSTQLSDAAQIRTANGGALPQVNLFGTGGESAIQSFRNQTWQLVYISQAAGSAPVFTFLMTGAYRNLTFHSGSNNDYSNSEIRANLFNDFEVVRGSFPGASDYIVKPQNLPGAWQSNQANAGNAVNNSISGAALNDLIWIPSSAEMGDGSNLWNLTQDERGFLQNDFSQYAWLRSGVSGSTAEARIITQAGLFAPGREMVYFSHAVRPAIHLTFPVVTNSASLLNTNSIHNTALAGQIKQLADQAAKTTVGNTKTSDASQIRTANGGRLPEVQLFQTVSTTSGTYSFTRQLWRLVYITHPSGGGAPVFTFMMADVYRDSVFHATSNIYETSTIRTNLVNEFGTVLSSFNSLTDYIVTPRNLPGTWQSNQPNSGVVFGNSISGVALDNSIWLPSSYELGDGGNLWNLEQSERAFEPNGFHTTAWLRSRVDDATNVRNVGSGGMFGSQASSNLNYAVRPAMHLTMPEPYIQDNELEYTLHGSYAEVTGATYPDAIAAVNIPATYSGLPVTHIGTDAFKNITRISSLSIGSNVTSIGADAFNGCLGLTGQLNIPNSVQIIGSYAFQNTGFSGTLTIPASVTDINDSAFMQTGFNRLILGSSVINIGHFAFYDCASLQGELTFPNSVQSIGTGAFSNCIGIQSLNLGIGLLTIGDNAFSGLTGLNTAIIIQNSVTAIGTAAFQNSNMTGITIGTGITSIGSAAFSGCRNVATLNWNVPAYGGSTGSLSAAVATHPFSSLGRNVVGGMTVTLGVYVTRIPNNFLYNNATLESQKPFISALNINANLAQIGDNAFRSIGLESLALPNSVTTIGAGAFQDCAGLAGLLSLSANVTSIGANSFVGTNISILSLKRFVTPGNGITAGPGGQFSSSLVRIVVPVNSGATYKASADWSAHADMIFEAVSPITFDPGAVPNDSGGFSGNVASMVDPFLAESPMLPNARFTTVNLGWTQVGWTLQTGGKQLAVGQTLSSSDFAMGAPLPINQISQTQSTFYAVWQNVVTSGVVYVHFVGGPSGEYLPGADAIWVLDMTNASTMFLNSAEVMNGLGAALWFEGWYMYTDLARTNAVKITELVNPGTDNRFVIPWDSAPTSNNVAIIRIYANWIEHS